MHPQSVAQHTSRPTRSPGLCFNCNQPGHYAKHCPDPRRTNRQAQNGSEDQRLSRDQQGDQNTSLRNGGVTTRNTHAGRHSTYLKARIGRRWTNCLLDTGSETTIIPAYLVQLEYVRHTSHTLTAANGTSIPLMGEVTLRMAIGDFTTSITGLVTEHVAEVMIGVDWMTANSVIWELGEGRIRIGDQCFKLESKPNKGITRRVYLQEDTIVPARSEIDLPTKVVCCSWKEKGSDTHWGTEAAVMQKGVYVSRTLIPCDHFRDIPVRAINVTKEPVHLSAGRRVAELHTVIICKPKQDLDEITLKSCATMENAGTMKTPEFIEKLIEGVHPSLSESAIASLRELLVNYQDVFSVSELDLGLTNVVKHRIDTGEAPPFRQQLRRFPPAHVKAISEHVDNMLHQGVIEPACSPYASNIVLVKKKDLSYRCCVDYRQLNSTTRKDAYPLPRIDVCLDAMASARWFSTFDLRSSYHQVQLEAEDMDKTAFICPRGMYRFRTMPFGLCNAGATFQRLMDIVLTGLNLTVCLSYLDDIVIFSTTVEQHLERLAIILQRLRESGLKLKPEKCCLLRKSVAFLGHVISENGIGTDPAKTQAVSDWPIPQCVKDIRSFLGLASYYRRFIQNFARIAAPLHAITRKNQRFEWSPEARVAFDTLKMVLTSAPILAMPTDDDDFVLDTYASDFAIGAVLSQKQDGVERVIAYASRSLDRREQNYCVTRKELLAVVHFLKFFKQYLLGRRFVVRTDHAALTWLKRTPEPIGQQARWLEQMEEYTFLIEHRPGVRHGNADAMSRRPCPKKNCVCRGEEEEDGQELFGGPADRDQSSGNTETENVRMTREIHHSDVHARKIEKRQQQSNLIAKAEENTEEVEAESMPLTGISSTLAEEPTEVHMSWTWEDLKAAQRNDSEIGPIIAWLEEKPEQPPWEAVATKSSPVKTLWHMWNRLVIQEGVLRRRFEDIKEGSNIWQIVIPKVYRAELMEIAHGGMSGGHLGLSKTQASIQLRAYWPTWKSDLAVFIRTCHPCAQYHRGTIRHQAPMQTPLVGEPWERVSIDITGPHPRSSRSKQFILTIVDHFSKWAEAIPLTNHTAPTVAKALMTHVFTRYGVPCQLLTDRGPEFESVLFTEMMQHLGVDKLRTTAYRASTNGVVERFHRTLNSMLGKVVSETQRDWDERLPAVMAAYRASPHSSTGFSPNRLFLGRENRMPVDIVWGIPEGNREITQPADEYVEKIKNDMEGAYELARKQLQVAAERRKATYDIRVKRTEFGIGDWVWYYYPRRYQGRSPKWQKLYTGPYLVTRMIPPVNYVLQKSARSKPFVVHVDKLKRCYGDTPRNWMNSGDDQRTESQPEDVLVQSPEIIKSQDGREIQRQIPTQANVFRRNIDDEARKKRCEQDGGSSRPKRVERRIPVHLKDFQLR
jgi:transposase InsO family protein